MNNDFQPLLDRIVSGFSSLLAENLVGIYLHGSLAMGCFNPLASDIDFLVVVREAISPAIKQSMIKLILDLAPDAPPKGVEFSVVLLEDTLNFVYPTPFEFHYGKGWHDDFLRGIIPAVTPQVDPDLAGHFVIIRERGRTLYGEPIEAVFSEIPAEHYEASIVADAEDILEDITRDPVYGVLNLCRVLAYQHEKLIVSKQEGGEWGLAHLDTRFAPLIASVLNHYNRQEAQPLDVDSDLLNQFAEHMRDQLQG